MTPDELAQLKAALTAAGDHLVNAINQVEMASMPSSDCHTTSGHELPCVTQASYSGQGFMVFISSTHLDLERERAAVAAALKHAHATAPMIAVIGTHGKTTLAETLIDFGLASPAGHSLIDAVLGESADEKAMSDFVEHAVIGYLSNGDAVGLAKLNAALPEDNEHVIEAPHMERSDAGIYADSILAFNGRSLDSHNPWHLTQSFEDYLAAETHPSEPARHIMEPSYAGIPSLAHPSEAGTLLCPDDDSYNAAPATNLGGCIAGKGHDTQQIERMLVRLTSAIATVFERPGAVHRDISPQNILLLKP